MRISGDLGSDAATTVFSTFDGDTTVEVADQWIGTDANGTPPTPALIHYVHGPQGLDPHRTGLGRSGQPVPDPDSAAPTGGGPSAHGIRPPG